MTLKRSSKKQSKQPNGWNEALEGTVVNDEQWSCMMIVMAESTPERSEYVRFFEETAEEASRRAIYSLTSRKLTNSVKLLSRYDEEKCPIAQGVCHHANRLLNRGEKLEAWLIARLVKFLVHRARTEAITKPKRDSDFENDADRMMTLNSKNVKSQGSVKSGKSKESTIEIGTKVNTRLRKRGEEIRDKIYVDDAPENGPKLYVILSGFYDSNLPAELIRAGFSAVCVLKIKGPRESFELEGDPRRSDRESCLRKNSAIDPGKDKFLENSTERVLHEFWSTLEKNANDPGNLEAYSGVIFRNFCPPELPSSDDKIDEFKKDLYDRISLIVYDLHDLQRLHSQYIKSMKLQHVPAEPKKEPKFYPKIMDEIPAECSFISVIMQAMLAEVEAGLNDVEKDDEIIRNREFSSPGKKIVLECDELKMKTRHVSLGDETVRLVNPKASSLAELAVRSLEDPRIFKLWDKIDIISEDIMEKRRNYVDRVASCFKLAKDKKRVFHYLNLRFLDKMIHGELNGGEAEDRPIEGKEYISLVSRSDPSPLSSKAIRDNRTADGNPISNLSSRWSDSIIDYHVSQTEILECSEVSKPPKSRGETLGEADATGREAGEKVGETGEDSTSYLEDFIDVLSLSSSTLWQAIHECFRKYQTFHSAYCEITDTILLCFGDIVSSKKFNNSSQENIIKDTQSPQTFKIMTPVCLRNFCEFVVHEAKEFIREVESSRAAKRSISVAELTRKLSHHGDSGILEITSFTEDDFILPNSLKGQARRREEKILMEVAPETKNTDGQTAKSQEDSQSRRKRISGKNTSREKNVTTTTTTKNEDDDVSVEKSSSFERVKDGEAYKFLGYDLGNFRIELTYLTETFESLDGTFVKVETEQWLYGQKLLRIGIDVPGCFFKFERIVEKNENLPFHLVTKNGVVVAFAKNKMNPEDSSNGNRNRRVGPFEFRVSWPSSLLVELVRGCDNNPFCVMQRYISKGPECGNVSRESYRKFLKNGTVLKFLDDNEVEVLRPNGTIVRCLEYSKFPQQFASAQHDDLARESWNANPGEGARTSPRRRQAKNSDDEHLIRESSFLPASSFERNSGEVPGEVKITRYTVVEHDGRRYEVENDEVSRVYDRSLVRMNTDVEVCEKFTRRDDGTRSVLNFNCELFVCFPDGTRIITGCVIEEQPVYCDWSDEEFARFFGDSDLKETEKEEAPSDANRSVSQNSDTREDDRSRLLSSDGFVSVLMTCRMEHECYASVVYEPIETSFRLSMPDELEICAHENGAFDVRLGQKVQVVVKEKELKISSSVSLGRESVSIYNLRETKSEEDCECGESLLVTKDSLGGVFEVNGDGSVTRNSPGNILKKRQRLFAVNRDFTGCEYLHKSEREERLKKIHPRGECVAISLDGFPEYRLFFNPLEPASYSKKWLKNVTRIRKTLKDGAALSRSTHANPFDWLFPFGKRSYVDAAPTSGDEGVLTLTILEGIANDGDRFLCELEQAIRHYQRKEIKPSDEDRFFEDESSSVCPRGKIEKILSDLALGIETSIDTLQYLRDLSMEGKDHKSEDISEPRGKRETRTRDSVKKEEILWYKRCIAERIILPYFKSIQGSCFLWIMDCVDRAFQLAE